jgi:hypothetical protein
MGDDLRERNRRPDGPRLLYNVKTGVLHSHVEGLVDDPLEHEAFLKWCVEYLSTPDHPYTLDMVEEMQQWQYHRYIECRDTYYQLISKQSRINVDGLRILIALASHQVEGDKLTQGLKALGYDFEGKLTSNYLGGWNYPEQMTTEQFIRSLLRRRE